MIVLCQFAHHYLSSDEQCEGLHGLFVSIVPTTCIPPISGLTKPLLSPFSFTPEMSGSLPRWPHLPGIPCKVFLNIQVCIINLYQLQFNYCKYHV